MLIFENGPGDYVAKVADFGFSTHFGSEQDLIKMPESVPWNAPERHHRHFLPQDAKAMDVYSFGMLCLWLLFGVESSKTTPSTSDTANGSPVFHFKAEDWHEKDDLLLSWKNNRLIEWAIWLVAEDERFATEMRDNLTQFFRSSLCFNPQRRITDWHRLLSYIAPAR